MMSPEFRLSMKGVKVNLDKKCRVIPIVGKTRPPSAVRDQPRKPLTKNEQEKLDVVMFLESRDSSVPVSSLGVTLERVVCQDQKGFYFVVRSIKQHSAASVSFLTNPVKYS